MRDLLKNYLEDKSAYAYSDVDVVDYTVDGHLCRVTFRHGEVKNYIDDGYRSEEIDVISVWDVITHIHSNLNIK
jgi:hypothetical protein